VITTIERYSLESGGSKEVVNYDLCLHVWDDAVAEISFGDGWNPLIDFRADSPEEAAAQALLWILKEEDKHE
jgi:hypothetical protein